jgi:O-antigen/teichoic acid export membrane protein
LKRKFLTNLILLILLNALVKPFWLLGVDRTIQNVVGAADYGFYFSLFNFSIILNILLDFGITNFNNRDISMHRHLVAKYLSNLVTAKFILGIIYAIVSIAIAWLIGYKWFQLKLLIILLFNQFVSSFILYLRSNISGLHFFKTDSILSVLDRFLMILICGILLWGNVTQTAFRIEWLVYSQTVSYLFTFCVVSVIVLTRTGWIRPKFDSLKIMSLLKRSIPFAILGLLMSVYTRIDTVMLERMLVDGKVQTGIYAQAYRILEAGSMIGYLFAMLLLPIFSRMLNSKDQIGQLLRFSFLLIILPVITLAVASLFYNYELMDLMYHKHVVESGQIFGLLMFSLVFISSGYIFGTLLTANGNLRQLNVLSATSVVLNIVLNLLFIPRYQALGSALASLVTLALVAITQIIMVKKAFTELIDLRLIKVFFFISGLILYGYLTEFFETAWYISFFSIFIFALLFSLLLGLVSFRKLREVFYVDQFLKD